MLRHALAAVARTSTVEGSLVESLAHMALRHPAAGAIVAHREYMTNRMRDWDVWAAWVEEGGRIRLFRPRGFVADFNHTRPSRCCSDVRAAACCGRDVPVAHLCPWCGFDTCVVCMRRNDEAQRWCGAWDAGVTSPACPCMRDRSGKVRQLPRGALCMIHEDTVLRVMANGERRAVHVLAPVAHVWQR